MKRIIIFTFFLIIINSLTYSWFKHDYTCLAFPDQCTDETTTRLTTPILGQLIPKAGVSFLESCRDYEDFLKELERAEIYGFDFLVLRDMIDNSITGMEKAFSIYSDIVSISESLVLDPIIFGKLIDFDYTCLKQKFNLNSPIFENVSYFCRRGDIKGIYKYTYENIRFLLYKLRQIKLKLDQCSMPELYLIWEIHQLYFESEMFGQYVSRIFFEITQEKNKKCTN